MLTSARGRDDDLIRARLRALLAEGHQQRGWVPEEAPDELDTDGAAHDDPEDDHRDHPPDDGDEWDDEDRRGTAPAVALPAALGRHRAAGRTARLDPGRPAAWALWVAGVLAAVLLVGWTWWQRPDVEPAPDVAAVGTAPADGVSAGPTPPAAAGAAATEVDAGGTVVVVSVVGQVVAPGLVTLPAGSRVADALAAAGGLLPEADPASVNAAAVLGDGQQVAVGVPGGVQPAGSGPAPGSAPGAPGGLLDLNAATAADLDALPGIGPVLAQRIVDHRTARGPFASVAQLDDVSGIGPAIFADLVDRVRV